jgi:hypothetical protein
MNLGFRVSHVQYTTVKNIYNAVLYKLAASLQSINIKYWSRSHLGDYIPHAISRSHHLVRVSISSHSPQTQAKTTLIGIRSSRLDNALTFYTPAAAFCYIKKVELLKLRPKMSALCLILLFTHVLVITAYVTWSQHWQHDCPKLYHFRRLTYN